MGLAPQLVEEIFEIVDELNAEGEGELPARRAEHQHGAALRPLRLHPRERPRRDGRQRRAAAPATRTSRNSTSASPPAAARASATSSTTSAASAGSRDRDGMTDLLRRARDRAIPSSASGGCSRRCPSRSRTPRRTRRAIAEVARRASSRRESPTARRSRRLPRDAQVGADRPAEARPRRPPPVRRADRAADRASSRASSPRPGPIYDPEGDAARLLAAGARAATPPASAAGDVVHNTFSYHFTPAGAMLESGAHALGCAVIPAGTGNTEMQVRAIADVKPKRLYRHAVVPEDHPRQGAAS